MSTEYTAATLLVDGLKCAGVKYLFTVSGVPVLAMYDACVDAGIELIHTRHEAAAVHMADAWGRLTEQPGVALVTGGPGFANGLSALYTAHEAESPLVLLSTHCPRRDLGRGGYQEMPQAQIAAPLTKGSSTLTEAASAAEAFISAFALARSPRPGPVYLSLPDDVMEQRVARDRAAKMSASPTRAHSLSTTDARGVLEYLLGAKRPLVICGPALMRSSATSPLRDLSTATGVPVVPTESAYGLDDPGLGAFAPVVREADFVLLLGKKLDWALGFGDEPSFDPGCRFLQIDAESDVLQSTSTLLEGTQKLLGCFQADPITAAQRLAEQAHDSPNCDSGWAAQVRTAIAYQHPTWPQLTSTEPDKLHPMEICRTLQQHIKHQDVVISDGGEFGYWGQSTLTSARRMVNGPSGLIGFAVPFAVAARLAFPDTRVFVTTGDGGFGFYPMEFDTALRYRLPFVAVVGNDARWNAEYQLQLQRYGPERTVACDLLPTRYDRIVASLGGHGEHVTAPDQLAPALERAWASGLPSCINVATQSVSKSTQDSSHTIESFDES